MSYVIGPECIDVNDRSCMDECPVDCIYDGERKAYINPAECIDCGACEVVCPVEAIFVDRKARGDEQRTTFVGDNAAFFDLPLAGRAEPVGTPGGAAKIGALGVDTPLVRDW